MHSFLKSQLSTLVSGADLNRILTSGYLNGEEDMGYLKRGVDLKVPKSPHFHRPGKSPSHKADQQSDCFQADFCLSEDFSYSNQANLVTPLHPHRRSKFLGLAEQMEIGLIWSGERRDFDRSTKSK
jgi:hypothetical protein